MENVDPVTNSEFESVLNRNWRAQVAYTGLIKTFDYSLNFIIKNGWYALDINCRLIRIKEYFV